MKKINLLIFAFLYAVVFSQTTFHGVDAHWYSTPKTVTAITGPVSFSNNVAGAVANCMVVKNNGTVIIFYKQNSQNKWLQSSDGGNSWTSPGSLPVQAINALSTISADIDQNDNVYIVWKTGTFSLGFSKFNGTSWSPTYTITTQSQTGSDTVSFSQITVDRKGRIHLMWQQGNHQNYSNGIKSTCWYARSTDGGNTFSSSLLLSQGNNYHAAFPVADFGGTAHDTLMIAWRENVNGGNYYNNWNWDVKARISYDGGANWNPVFTLEGSTVPGDHDQWDPNIIVDKNGVLHAFYHVYHDATMPDYNANIMYKYSLNAGNSWSSPQQLSTTNIRSHLIKTAYDYVNNAVWCTWKDEMDFGNIPNNPQADLKAVYIVNTGTPVISAQEFICDHGSNEVALHNFKVGNDGIMRATYNTSKLNGKGDTIFYTQRTTLNNTLGLSKTPPASQVVVYPNPTKDYIHFNFDTFLPEKINVYDAMGRRCEGLNLLEGKVYLPVPGLYLVEIRYNNSLHYIKVIRE